MSILTFLLDMFQDEEDLTEVADDSAGGTTELPEGLTSAEFNEGVLSVCGELPPEQADVVRAAYGIPGPDGSPPPPPPAELPPPPVQNPGEPDGDFVVRQVNYFHEVVNVTNQHYEDNDTTVIDDRDTNVDNSINQDITAFGDVNQDFDQDNDVVTGDGNALANDGGVANSGDGAVVAGDDIEDSTIATGPVGGSVTGDVNDSIVGDGNAAIIDSSVDGPVAFGGDAIEAENVAQGGSTIQEDIDGDANANTGSGTQTVVQDSELDESAVGGSQVQSNDVDIDAEDGSAVAFGQGSEAEGNQVESTNVGGTTQIAGDDSTQLGQTDNSVDVEVEDSFNTDNSVDESVEIEDSFTVDDSFQADESFNEDTNIADDDVIDV